MPRLRIVDDGRMADPACGLLKFISYDDNPSAQKYCLSSVQNLLFLTSDNIVWSNQVLKIKKNVFKQTEDISTPYHLETSTKSVMTLSSSKVHRPSFL